MLVIFIVLTVALMLTIPFVKLYTAGVTDVDYIDSIFAMLFAIISFFVQLASAALFKTLI